MLRYSKIIMLLFFTLLSFNCDGEKEWVIIFSEDFEDGLAAWEHNISNWRITSELYYSPTHSITYKNGENASMSPIYNFFVGVKSEVEVSFRHIYLNEGDAIFTLSANNGPYEWSPAYFQKNYHGTQIEWPQKSYNFVVDGDSRLYISFDVVWYGRKGGWTIDDLIIKIRPLESI